MSERSRNQVVRDARNWLAYIDRRLAERPGDIAWSRNRKTLRALLAYFDPEFAAERAAENEREQTGAA